ncbi:uncharacterized protein CLUP02_03555 [Colletotrichum lupini]|uniref:Uncharacterized protein n=1 Tax=Colletotrichum lupini TaxID=145971 RepID=A0A9Q8WCG6_9PEZI|nr:uncharacterized protein CLUP02_03555 [Colletotrichum lupini]UQC78081.1 hypothetical protein CLUP02_03555 [Colletotrichum lupini]
MDDLVLWWQEQMERLLARHLSPQVWFASSLSLRAAFGTMFLLQQLLLGAAQPQGERWDILGLEPEKKSLSAGLTGKSSLAFDHLLAVPVIFRFHSPPKISKKPSTRSGQPRRPVVQTPFFSRPTKTIAYCFRTTKTKSHILGSPFAPPKPTTIVPRSLSDSLNTAQSHSTFDWLHSQLTLPHPPVHSEVLVSGSTAECTRNLPFLCVNAVSSACTHLLGTGTTTATLEARYSFSAHRAGRAECDSVTVYFEYASVMGIAA